MRTLLTRSLTFVLILLTTFACTKKKEFNPPCLLNSVQSGPYTTYYYYQNGKLRSSAERSSVSPTDSSTYTYTDVLITQVTNPPQESFDRKEFLYDAQGRIVSTKGYAGTVVEELLQFYYSGNNSQPDSMHQTLNSGGNIYTSSYNYQWLAGNLTRYEDKFGITTYTYDSLNNPLSLTGIPNALLTKNNKKTEAYQLKSSGGVTNYTYTYLYNTKGYPLSSTESGVGSPIETVYTYITCD